MNERIRASQACQEGQETNNQKEKAQSAKDVHHLNLNAHRHLLQQNARRSKRRNKHTYVESSNTSSEHANVRTNRASRLKYSRGKSMKGKSRV